MMTFISGRHPPPDFKSNQWEMCTSAISLVLTLFFIYYLNFILSKSSDGKAGRTTYKAYYFIHSWIFFETILFAKVKGNALNFFS